MGTAGFETRNVLARQDQGTYRGGLGFRPAGRGRWGAEGFQEARAEPTSRAGEEDFGHQKLTFASRMHWDHGSGRANGPLTPTLAPSEGAREK
ncbi:hypothetical protein SBV1_60031 [Verrucomicrobia bacterium]|nr:hypothetical protein SBV1_60031 [Verrucomicrobiota bacterium]